MCLALNSLSNVSIEYSVDYQKERTGSSDQQKDRSYTNCDQCRAWVLPTRPGTPQKAFSMYRECDFSSEELRWLRPEIAPGVVQNPRTDVLKVRKSSQVFNFCWDWLSICAIYMGVLDRRIRTDEYY